MMTIELCAEIKDGNGCTHLEDLWQPEFLGEGVTNIEEAREAAKDAYAYIGGDVCESVCIYIDGSLREYFDAEGLHCA